MSVFTPTEESVVVHATNASPRIALSAASKATRMLSIYCDQITGGIVPRVYARFGDDSVVASLSNGYPVTIPNLFNTIPVQLEKFVGVPSGATHVAFFTEAGAGVDIRVTEGDLISG